MKARLLKLLSYPMIFGVFFYFGRSIAMQAQLALYDQLRDAASLIFAVLGIWIAIICPDFLPRLEENKIKAIEKESHRMSNLVYAMMAATVVVVSLLLISFLVPLAKTSTFMLQNREIFRGASYGLLATLNIALIKCLIFSLGPTLEIWTRIQHLNSQFSHLKGLRSRSGGQLRTASRKDSNS